MWTTPFKFLDSIFDRVLAVVGGLLLAQVPAFMTAYMQRLEGHVDEAQRNIASWQVIADRVHMGDLNKLMESYQASEQVEVSEAGNKMAFDVTRLEELQKARNAIANASVWERGLIFSWHMDQEIAGATAREFVPNLPLDPQSIVYGLLGLLLALSIYQGSKAGIRGIGRKVLNRSRSQVPPRRRDSPAS